MQKSGHYRKAIWTNVTKVFASVLADCFARIDSKVIHTFDHGEEQCLVAASNSYPDGSVYLHLVTYEKGAGAAVISLIKQGPLVDADEVGPPPTQEYVRSQVFLVARKDDVVWTTHNSQMRDGTIRGLVADFISSLRTDKHATAFQFQVRVDHDTLRLAFEQGIEKIDLGLGDFRSMLEMFTQAGALPSLGIFSSIRNLVSPNPTRDELKAASMIEGNLVLRPGRDWSKPEVVELMADFADNISESGHDEFSIVTKSGLRLTRDKMSVKRGFSVDGNNRILKSTQVADELFEVFNKLIEVGVIDNG